MSLPESVTIIDTIHADVPNIPRSAPKVGGYVTGTPDIQWTAEDWARFPEAGHVPVNQDPADPSTHGVADVEEGAYTIAEAVERARARKSAGYGIYNYTDEANVSELCQALTDGGIDGSEIWLANWNLSEEEAAGLLGQAVHGYPGHVIKAVQWASPTSNPDTKVPGSDLTLKAANVDLSVSVPSWFAHLG